MKKILLFLMLSLTTAFCLTVGEPNQLGAQHSLNDWKKRVVANGGTYNDTDSKAAAIILYGLMNKLGYPIPRTYIAGFIGRDLLAAMVPLYYTIGTSPMTNSGYVGGDFTPTTGLTSGSNKRLTAGITESANVSQNDASIFSYLSTLGTPGTLRRIMAGATNTYSQCYIVINVADGFELRVNSTTNVAAGTFTGGLLQVSRLSASTVIRRSNNSELVSSVTSAPNDQIGNAFMNLVSGGNSPFDGRMGSMGYLPGLTSNQMTYNYQIFEQAMDALGRGVNP